MQNPDEMMDATEQIARNLIGSENFNQKQEQVKRNLLNDQEIKITIPGSSGPVETVFN